MRISVITVVKNNERTIRQAIESTLNQKGIDLEYIVLDGMSTDNTLKIIDEYKDKITIFKSEKDRNLYHALNKAIAMATGDVVAILHSDDVYATDTILKDVVEKFKDGHSIVYGDLAIVRHDDTRLTVRRWRSGHFKKYKMYLGWMPPHPAFFVRRDLYDRYGMFDTDIRISADYDLMLRFMVNEGRSSCYLDRLIVKMRAGGTSNNTPLNIFRKMSDDYRVVKRHNLAGLFTMVMKKLSKVHQYAQVDNLKASGKRAK
ncbi:MAG: glycosyltransferase family 2 protein [Deferribacterales bacterium]